MKNTYNINNEIQSEKVDLVLSNGEISRSISLLEALKIADEEGLDVVEVSVDKNEELPVCKLMDYGKLLYNKSKNDKTNKKQHSHQKEIKYGFNIDKHDLDVKHNKIFKFLEKRYTVRYIMELKGREKHLLNEAKIKMTDNLESFREIAQWEDVKINEGPGKTTLSVIFSKI